MRKILSLILILFCICNLSNVNAETELPSPKEVNEQIMPFSVYPNPLTGKKLVISLNFATQAADVTFSISNVLGQTVFTHKLSAKDYTNGSFTADLSNLDLKKGIYLIKMTMDSKSNVQKLVIR